jgi:hypothetical protein
MHRKAYGKPSFKNIAKLTIKGEMSLEESLFQLDADALIRLFGC